MKYTNRAATITRGAFAGLLSLFTLAAMTHPEPAVTAHGEVRFDRVRLATGVEIGYATAGPADGQPVILLHGYSDSWFSFSQLLDRLPPDVRAFALDQRGHGDSERPEGGYAPADLAADVVAFMDAKGIDRATVVGHSLGGYVAQWVAAIAPERVARLVVMSSTTAPRAIPGLDQFAAEVKNLTDPVPAEFAREFQVSTIHAPVAPEFLDRVVAESGKLPAHVWRSVMQGMLDTPAPGSLAAHRIPTLILWGDRDAYMPESEQYALLQQHGTAMLRIYRDTGHAPHWERPDEVARDLAAFLRIEPAALR